MPWIEALPLDDLGEDRMVAVELGGTRVALARVDGAPAAFRNECTHERCELSDGYLEGAEIECPCHGAVFDIRTGAVVVGPAVVALTVYATSISEGIVFVELS